MCVYVLAAAAYVWDEPVDTSTPYIHTSNDVSDDARDALVVPGEAGFVVWGALTSVLQAYDTIYWDAILRHTKFTIGFLVEAAAYL